MPLALAAAAEAESVVALPWLAAACGAGVADAADCAPASAAEAAGAEGVGWSACAPRELVPIRASVAASGRIIAQRREHTGING
ncbi:hypothetical protein GCM10022270_24140 [Terriglobus aquaticus]